MPDERWIRVSAVGEASVAPDLALVSFAVSGRGRELGSTRDDVNARSSALLARLREMGVADADLNAPDVSIHPEYDHRQGRGHGEKLVGYRVARRMAARVRDLNMLGAVLDGLVEAGANEIGGAEMTAADPSAAEHAALRAAMAAARAKAQALADAAGLALGAVMRVEEEDEPGAGPMPRLRLAAMAESADVPTEVAAGDLTVSLRIQTWFQIGD